MLTAVLFSVATALLCTLAGAFAPAHENSRQGVSADFSTSVWARSPASQDSDWEKWPAEPETASTFTVYYDSKRARWLSADPELTKARAHSPLELSAFLYANSNPIRFIDTNGKWPTEIHNQIIDQAFPGLSSTQRAELKTASHWVDRVAGQTKNHNAEHAMRSASTNTTAAKTAIQKNIDSHTDAAKRVQGHTPEHASELYQESLHELGLALHGASDQTSPAHTDHDGNPKIWSGIPISPKEIEAVTAHEAEESTISPDQMKQAVNAERQLFGRAFGTNALNEAATNPTESEPLDPPNPPNVPNTPNTPSLPQ
jgi:hypothetical protein